MELNLCHCCLQRPAARDLQTPYSGLGVKETYSVMIEECFVIKLAPDNNGKSGICEECVESLLQACRFKTQVQRCQGELQARVEVELTIKGEEIKSEVEDRADTRSETGEETAINVVVDVKHEDDEACPDRSRVSTVTHDERVSPTPVPARARQQLSLACCVRLERLRDVDAPHDARTTPAPSRSLLLRHL